MRSFDWYQKTQDVKDGALGPYTSLLFELFCTSDSKSGRFASAWPRPAGFRHMVLIQTGHLETGPLHDYALDLLLQGSKDILGPDAKQDITANAIEPFHNMRDVSILVFILQTASIDVFLGVWRELRQACRAEKEV